MGQGSGEQFIHFTPDVPDPRRGAAPASPRAAVDGAGRWAPVPADPLRTGDGQGRPVSAASRAAARPAPPAVPAPAGDGRGRSADGRVRVREDPAPASPGATERRDPRSAHQDEWLNAMRRARRHLDVVCLGGEVLRGRIVGFDTYALIVECEGVPTLIFKHAIRLLRPSEEGPEA